jgi:hypothetical protein
MGALQRIEKSARQIELTDYAVIETGALEAIVEGGKLAAAIAGGPPGLALYALSAAGDPAVQGAVTAGSLAVQTANDLAQTVEFAGINSQLSAINARLSEISGKIGGQSQKADLSKLEAELKRLADEAKGTREALENFFKRPAVDIDLTAGVTTAGNLGIPTGPRQIYKAAVGAWLKDGYVVDWKYINWSKQTLISPSSKVSDFKLVPFPGFEFRTRRYTIGEKNQGGTGPAPAK